MKRNEWHGHIALGEKTIEEKIRLLHESEVVYFRDAGASPAHYEKLGINATDIKAIMADNGIEFKTPIYAFYKEGLYGKFLGKSFSDTKDFAKQVHEVKEAGADFIKVMYSGIASYKNIGTLTCVPLSKKEISEIVSICHSEGLKVMAHCNGAETIKNAIDAGTDSIEHGIFIDDEGIKMLLATNNKTIWVPTVVAIANDEIRNAHLEKVKQAKQLGVKIQPGSDCGSSSVAFGRGIIEEYNYLEI